VKNRSNQKGTVQNERRQLTSGEAPRAAVSWTLLLKRDEKVPNKRGVKAEKRPRREIASDRKGLASSVMVQGKGPLFGRYELVPVEEKEYSGIVREIEIEGEKRKGGKKDDRRGKKIQKANSFL